MMNLPFHRGRQCLDYVVSATDNFDASAVVGDPFPRDAGMLDAGVHQLEDVNHIHMKLEEAAAKTLALQ
jgi:hypothetical protein